MTSRHIHTIAAIDQLEATGKKQLFHGEFLRGHREPRVAFVGRSNVGKSSLINAILGARLAQVSKEPGKTRAIHLYMWEEARKILADLPGYGFAKVTVAERNRWAEFIQAYIAQDPALQAVVILLDARHGPSDLDLEALKFFLGLSVRVWTVFSKADTLKKMTQSERALRKREGEATLEELGIRPEDVLWVSAEEKDLGFANLLRKLKSPE